MLLCGKPLKSLKKYSIYLLFFSLGNFLILSTLIAYTPDIFQYLFRVKIIVKNNDFHEYVSKAHSDTDGHSLLLTGKITAVRSLKLVKEQASTPVPLGISDYFITDDENTTTGQGKIFASRSSKTNTKNDTLINCPCKCILNRPRNISSKEHFESFPANYECRGKKIN